jgi:hypothetical protein
MINERRVCSWEKCEEEFTPVTSNQIYHSEECQRLATNARIMRKYYERKAIRQGARRVCEAPGCVTILSRYNDSKLCATHEAKPTVDKNKKLLESLKSWA